MVLKQELKSSSDPCCFRSLQTYMVLKRSYSAIISSSVLDPYKLTWFSNYFSSALSILLVLDPYKLTWFSNTIYGTCCAETVLDPYKLTWFSNLKFKNFAVLTELLHTDICCKPIFLIPHVYFTT